MPAVLCGAVEQERVLDEALLKSLPQVSVDVSFEMGEGERSQIRWFLNAAPTPSELTRTLIRAHSPLRSACRRVRRKMLVDDDRGDEKRDR
jgi:hypothetical protein